MRSGTNRPAHRSLPSDTQLLSREDFDFWVKHRSHGRCVLCGVPAMCSACHWDAETTTVSVETIRSRAGIITPVLPPHFSSTHVYDKWRILRYEQSEFGEGETNVSAKWARLWDNRCIEHGMRESGPLGEDTGMQRALQAGGFRGLLVPAP